MQAPAETSVVSNRAFGPSRCCESAALSYIETDGIRILLTNASIS